MFLLRCAFWLSIVYASMSWGGDALRHHASFEAATQAAASGGAAVVDAVAERAVASATSFCRDHEAQCLRDAVSMTGLVQTALQQDDADDAKADQSIVQDAAEVPVPPPAPRRRVASTVLTRVR